MKVSTRGRYSLRAMLELAEHFGEKPITAGLLAERQNLSLKYLQTLLTSLKAARLVRPTRGPGGGFTLARPPQEIRLNEILAAVEGPLSLVDCVTDEGLCGKSQRCTARRIWRDLGRGIDEMLASVTLDELAIPQDRKRSGKRRFSLTNKAATANKANKGSVALKPKRNRRT